MESPRSETNRAQDAVAAPEATASWYVVTGGNDVWWRCEAPAEHVGGRVVKIPEDQSERAIMGPNRDTAFPWSIVLMGRRGGMQIVTSRKRWERLCADSHRIITATAEFPQHEGVAVWTRPDPPRAILAQAMMRRGIRVIAETDDNYFADARFNLFQRTNNYGPAEMELHAKAFASFPVNVFSTSWLRDTYARQYRERFGKKIASTVEMHVCRNHMPRAMWPHVPVHDGQTRVGFMGSPSHVWDINLAYSAFHAAKQLGARTIMVGYSPGNPDPDRQDSIDVTDEETGETTTVWARNEKSREVSGKWAQVIDDHVRWIAPDDFHRALIPFDIGVAPLWHNAFTAGKSDIKAIEYTVSGAAVVCANLPVYTSNGWKDGVNCLTANKPEEYGQQVVRLLKDRGLRTELVLAARDMVYNERNETHLAAEWSDALAL